MQNRPKRNHNLTDEELVKRAKEMLKSLKRDAEEFKKAGVTEKDIADFEERIKHFESLVEQDKPKFKYRRN